MTYRQAKRMDIILKGFLNPKKEVLGYANAKSVRDNCTELKMVSDKDFEHLLYLIRKEQLKIGVEFITGNSIFKVNKKPINDFLNDNGFKKIARKREIEFYIKRTLQVVAFLGIIKIVFLAMDKLNAT